MKVTSKILLLSLFAIFSAQAMEELSSGKLTQIKKSSLFATHDVGEVDLFHNDKGFHVVQDDEVYTVNPQSLDPLLRTLKHKQLKKFQKIGYIQVKKNEDNEFSLVSKVRAKGGGPVLAAGFYWATKALCYGGMIAAAGAAVGATGGGAVVLAGAGEILAVSGSGVAAVAIGSSATATAAATAGTTVAVVAGTTGGVAAVVAGVESASCVMAAIGMAIPFL